MKDDELMRILRRARNAYTEAYNIVSREIPLPKPTQVWPVERLILHECRDEIIEWANSRRASAGTFS